MAEDKAPFKRYMTSRTTTEFVNGKEIFRKIPVPAIPVFPVMSWAGLFPLTSSRIPSLLQNPSIHYFTAGRYAIYQALIEMGAKEKDKILIPAYHCEAMIHPILDAGCIPVFYKIRQDFSADIEDIESLVTDDSKAVIAVNYFGFSHNIQDVRKFCNQQKLQLIEDCAHSLFGSNNNIAMGQTGDYAIGSTKKFFPVEKGGILICNKDLMSTHQPEKYHIKSEMRFIYNTIERSLAYGRLWIFMPLIALIERLRHSPQAKESPTDEICEEYSPSDRTERPEKLSMLLERYISHRRIFIKRRKNYAFLVNNLKKNHNITLPITDIPPGTVPYMLPVIIENLEEIFPQIEDAAIPFQRFGQFLWQGSERCTVSRRYAKTIVQLPCHQELSERELLLIVEKLCTIVGNTANSKNHRVKKNDN